MATEDEMSVNSGCQPQSVFSNRIQICTENYTFLGEIWKILSAILEFLDFQKVKSPLFTYKLLNEKMVSSKMSVILELSAIFGVR